MVINLFFFFWIPPISFFDGLKCGRVWLIFGCKKNSSLSRELMTFFYNRIYYLIHTKNRWINTIKENTDYLLWLWSCILWFPSAREAKTEKKKKNTNKRRNPTSPTDLDMLAWILRRSLSVSPVGLFILFPLFFSTTKTHKKITKNK